MALVNFQGEMLTDLLCRKGGLALFYLTDCSPSQLNMRSLVRVGSPATYKRGPISNSGNRIPEKNTTDSGSLVAPEAWPIPILARESPSDQIFSTSRDFSPTLS